MTRDYRFESDSAIRERIRREESRWPSNPLREHPVHRWDRERDVEAAREELRRRERERLEEEERERAERRREREEQERREQAAREEAWEHERREAEARRDREFLEDLFRRAVESGKP